MIRNNKRQYSALFLTRIITFAILLLSNDPGVRAGKTTSARMDDTVMCPKLYFHDIKVLDSVTMEEKNEPSPIEEKVLLVCGKDSDEYDVFPASQRICQHDGTWSSHDVIPACIGSEPHHDSINSVANHCDDGKSLDCSQLVKKWKKVGKMINPPGNTALNLHVNLLDENNGYEIQEILYRFRKRLFLSFMTFDVPLFNSNGNTKNYAVQMYAPPEDVLHDAYSSTVLLNHFDSFKESNTGWQIFNKNAVIDIRTYSKQVLVRFITWKEKDYDAKYNRRTFKYSWDPGTIFFPLLSPQSYETCPKEPTIANAIVSDRSRRSVTYKCQDGSNMFDLFSEGSLLNSGTIDCLDGNWELRPFPVCRNVHEKTQLDSLDVKENKETKMFHSDHSKMPRNFSITNIPDHPLVDNCEAMENNLESGNEKVTQTVHLMMISTFVAACWAYI